MILLNLINKMKSIDHQYRNRDFCVRIKADKRKAVGEGGGVFDFYQCIQPSIQFTHCYLNLTIALIIFPIHVPWLHVQMSLKETSKTHFYQKKNSSQYQASKLKNFCQNECEEKWTDSRTHSKTSKI